MTPRAPVPGRAESAWDAAARLVAGRPWLSADAHAWIGLAPGDLTLVGVGDELRPETVVAERLRDPRVTIVAARDTESLEPGRPLGDAHRSGRRGRAGHPDETGTILHRMPDGRARAVTGHLRESVLAHVAGRVVAAEPGGLEIALDGQSLPLAAVAGEAVHGILRLATHDPGEELRPAALHVADAGCILVAGARVDVETLTRARAMGLRGMVSGGIAGHDLRDFVASEARQRAVLHPLPGFAAAVVEGFGRRTLAGPPFELLAAAAEVEAEVAILPDPPLLVFPPGLALPAVAAGSLRVAAGPGAGATGRLSGEPAVVRCSEGTHLLAAPFAAEGRRWTVPLADLERFR